MEFICSDCPRRCGILRKDRSPAGICRSPALPRVARAAAHFGEEPCISGQRGSGTIFFTGCNLRCVFCQNLKISRESGNGLTVTVSQLKDMMLRLRDLGVHNINLVTGSHYVRPIAEALSAAKLDIPVVWNSSAYELPETLQLLEGLVQIYMPDYKYFKGDIARRYSAAGDYPQVAAAAIKEMFRQVGPYVMGEDGMLKSGVLIRHLILPQQELSAMDAMDFAAEEFPENSVLFSLMGQYTPMPDLEGCPELQERVSQEVIDNLRSYMVRRGLEGYWQDAASATDEMIPAFDLTGV